MERRTQGKVVVITGASSGFGKAAAEQLAEDGHRVYGLSVETVRPDRTHGGRLQHLRVDIRSDAQVRAAIQAVVRREKRIDVLVNNAGVGVAGAVDETSTEEAQDLFEVNFWGLHRLCRLVIPQMRRQGRGTIINVGSMAGLQAIPFQGFYSASKYAVEGLTEALSMELKPFGIRVCVVEPGDAATSFVKNRAYSRQSRRSAYGGRFRSVMRTVERDEENGMDPRVVGRRIARIAERGPRKFHYMVGDPLQRAAVRVKPLIPHGLFEGGALLFFGARDGAPGNGARKTGAAGTVPRGDGTPKTAG